MKLKLKLLSGWTTTQSKLIVLVSIFFTLFYNFSFFKKVIAVYPIGHQLAFIISIAIAVACATNLILSLLRFKFLFKPVLIILIILTSLTAYFMDSYGVVIDEGMIVNILKTDFHESLDLISPMLFVYLILLGLLPAYIVYKSKIRFASFKEEMCARLQSIALSIVIIFGCVVVFGKSYATFFREHKPLRYYTNPAYYIYSTGYLASLSYSKSKSELVKIGLDARISSKAQKKNKKLVIFVLGETARGDHFSLNGYKKLTNPLLSKEKVVSFSNMTSCGTSTATSVPCLFSNLGRNKFNNNKAATTENLLDVLGHTKNINVLWRDNNSNSKGVADRSHYEDFKGSNVNPLCNPECRDEGMLKGLQDYIEKSSNSDIFIVLHQMGNHGPAYFTRYPKEFEKFKPVCKTNELEKCTNEEISNAYDNALIYTDYFLSKVINLLKENSKQFETVMIYSSDHGESLGENGVYLHGLPYFMAPYEQKHIGVVMWYAGKQIEKEMNFENLKSRSVNPYSHDNLFHTVLGLFDVETTLYDQKLDILDGVRIH